MSGKYTNNKNSDVFEEAESHIGLNSLETPDSERSEREYAKGKYRKYTNNDNSFALNLDTVFYDVLKQWWVILLAAFTAALVMGAFVKFRYEPVYNTSTTFVVSKNGISTSNAAENIQAATVMTDNITTIVKSNILKNRVNQQLGISINSNNISVTTVESTNLMTLYVSGNNPREAWLIAKEVMRVAQDISAELEENLTVITLEEPKIPVKVSNPLNVKKPMCKAFLIVLMLMIVFFALLSVFHDTVKSENEFSAKIDGVLLGTIPRERKFKSLQTIRNRKKYSLCIDNMLLSFSYVESVRLMATRIFSKMKSRGKVLVVSSVSENEGKSTVAANLGISLAEEGKKVCLVDCDFRKPSLYKVLDIPKEEIKQNLVDAFENKSKCEALKNVKCPGLDCVLNTKSANHVFSYDNISIAKEAFDYLKQEYDLIIVDTSPLGLVAEGERIASIADDLLLVVAQNEVETIYINDTIDQLWDNDIQFLGCIFNKVRTGIGSTFVNHASYSYGGNRYNRYGKYGHYGKYNTDSKSKKNEMYDAYRAYGAYPSERKHGSEVNYQILLNRQNSDKEDNIS